MSQAPQSDEPGPRSDEPGPQGLMSDPAVHTSGAEPAELLEELLVEVSRAMDLDVEVIVEEAEGVLIGRVEGQDVGPFIGRRGHTIDAVQHLAQRIAVHGEHGRVRVVIDADGYREHRAEERRAEADDAADDAIRSGHPVELDPMPASERRVVHEHLRERGDVETHSEGEEPDRFLVISPLGE
jgi:spoIIIJ-associated protein